MQRPETATGHRIRWVLFDTEPARPLDHPALLGAEMMAPDGQETFAVQRARVIELQPSASILA